MQLLNRVNPMRHAECGAEEAGAPRRMRTAHARMGAALSVVLAGTLAIYLCGGSFASVSALAAEGGSAAGSQQGGGTPASGAGATGGAAANATPKEEVVYARLSAAGAVDNVYVVNVLKPASPSAVTDFGSYDAVQNLTDASGIEQTGDAVKVNVAGDSLSYQGDLGAHALPWDVAVTYELDGKRMEPADLGGASGRLAIAITTKKNASVDASFYDNYLLQITVPLASDKAADVATADGQIALAGSNTQVTFTGMPGKDGSFKVEAQVSDFALSGITFAAVPFSMGIEAPDTEGLVSGFRQLGDGVGQLKTGAGSLASGAGSLAFGVGEVASGLGGLAAGAGQLTGGANELTGGAQGVAAGAQGVAEGAEGLSGGARQLAESSASIKSNLDTLSASGGTLATSSETIKSTLDGLSPAASAASALLNDPEFQALLATDPAFAQKFASTYATPLGTIGAALPALAGQYGEFNTGLAGYTGGVSALAGGFGEFDAGVGGLASGASTLAVGASELASGASQLASGAGALASGTSELASGANQAAAGAGQLSSGASQLSSGAAQLASGTGTLYQEVQGIPAKVQKEIDAMMADYDKSDFKPVSFTSAKNTGVTLVQFVMSTDPIEAPAAEEPVVDELEQGIWDRLLALFGK